MINKPSREARKTQLLQNWPENDDIIHCLNNEPAIVTVEYRGDRRVMWTTAIIDDDATGWYLSLNPIGVKCMIFDKYHDSVTVSYCEKTDREIHTVYQLIVLREAVNSKALVCGVIDEQK